MLATADPVLHPRTTDPHDDDAVALAHELADARRRIAALTALSELGVALATASRREELYRLACAGVRRLLDADGCRLHLVDADGGRLVPAYASPREALGADARPARLIDALRAGPGERAVVAPLTAGDADVGMLVAQRARPFAAEDERLLQVVGHQLAAALQKADLIERLTEEHVVRDLFDALAEGRPQAAESRARAAGLDGGAWPPLARAPWSCSSRWRPASRRAAGPTWPRASRRGCGAW